MWKCSARVSCQRSSKQRVNDGMHSELDESVDRTEMLNKVWKSVDRFELYASETHERHYEKQ